MKNVLTFCFLKGYDIRIREIEAFTNHNSWQSLLHGKYLWNVRIVKILKGFPRLSIIENQQDLKTYDSHK